MSDVIIYTDGACIGNPGPGGYGVLLITAKQRKELSGGFRLTTNNRMELMAAIVGLSSLKDQCIVTLFSDSRYLVDAMNLGWVQKWRAKGWKRGKAENVDLWERLLVLCGRHEVTFNWVEGHASNPYNNRCDVLSVQAAKEKNLLVDEPYENGETKNSSQMLFDFKE